MNEKVLENIIDNIALDINLLLYDYGLRATNEEVLIFLSEIVKRQENKFMNEYILRWQYGLFNEEVKTHYTYGHINTLKEKAKELAKNDKILYITIDKVEEVIKDTRTKKMIEYIEGGY